ncbi:hypothetical protein [Pedobacter agri]|uniref:hypothetical protein n=1 Tax=Pedobacter agri TaxID=454586 RepID=UPI00292EEBA2|nr:hypothetical protein [Pedobacter agri]
MQTKITDIRTEYGIFCQREDEKDLVKRINNFLKNEYGYRKMYKRDEDAISTFNYDYYYFQFIRETPKWYFDLYPNEDLDGKLKFDNQDTKWILYTGKLDVNKNSDKQNEEVNLFFEKLIQAIGYETQTLHEYKDDFEERIGNIDDE